MVKKLKKKNRPKSKSRRFFFGYRVSKARLHFRKSFTNIFLTLTDLRNKVIYALSAGQCAQNNNRRQKTAPFVMEAMTNKINKVLRNFRITSLEIIVKSTLRVHIRILVHRLGLANYIISAILDRRLVAHNGVRSRAPKRR